MGQQINLFNPDLVKQGKNFSLVTMLQGLGMILAGSLFFYWYAAYQVSELEKQSAQNSRTYDAEQVRLAGYAAEFSPQKASQALQDEVRRLEKQVADQTALVETIKSGALGNTTGYSEYMRAFSRQVVQGLWLTSFSISSDTSQISLSGMALSPGLLPAYIQRLGNESIMQGKTFTTLQMRQQKVDASHDVIVFTLHSSKDEGVKK